MRKAATTKKILTVVAAIMLNSLVTMADEKGRLKGRISDQLGAAIEKTRIIVESPPEKVEAIANENGEYDLEIPAGVYKVTTRKRPGFIPFKRDRVRVEAGKTTTLDIKLKVTSKDAICVLYVTGSVTKKRETRAQRRSKN